MKQVLSFLLHRRIASAMLLLALVTAGIFSFFRLDFSVNAEENGNSLALRVRYPGQSPWRIEKILTIPLEEALTGLPGMKQIISSCQEGETRIYLTFRRGTDMRYMPLRLRERIDLVRGSFPRDVEEPEIHGSLLDDRPVMTLALESDRLSAPVLRELAERSVRKDLQRIDGVSEVIIGGGVRREIRVRMRESHMGNHGTDFRQIRTSLEGANTGRSLGLMVSDIGRPLILEGKFTRFDDIGHTPLLCSSSGSPLLLSAAASLTDFAGQPESISRIDGKEGITLHVFRNGSADTLALGKGIRTALPGMNREEYQLRILHDQSVEIRRSLNSLIKSCLSGSLLVLIALALCTRALSQTLPAFCVIPFSLCAILFIFQAFEITLNPAILTGIGISAGLVVDSCIIVLETLSPLNGLARPSGDYSELIKSVAGTVKPLTASTLTTLCIFLPQLLLNRSSSDIFKNMAVAVTAALSVSLLLSVTLMPSLAVLIAEKSPRWRKYLCVIINARTSGIKPANPFPALLIPARTFLTRLRSKYPRQLTLPSLPFLFTALLNNRRLWLWGLISSLMIAVLLPSIMRTEYFHTSERSEIFLTFELPPGTSLDETSRRSSAMEKALLALPQITGVTSRVEKWHGEMIIKIQDSSQVPTLTRMIKDKFRMEPGTSLFLQEGGSSKDSREIDLHITGPDILVLRSIARDLAGRLKSQEGIEDIIYRFREGRPEIQIIIDRAKTLMSGLTPESVASHLRHAVFGPVASKLITGTETDIRLQLDRDFSLPHSLDTLSIPGPEGRLVPLRELAVLKESQGIITLWRRNRSRMETLTLKTGHQDMEALEKSLNTAIKAATLPEGYSIEFSDRFSSLKERLSEAVTALLLSVLLVYMVLAAIYESFRLPLILLSVIPPGLAGTLICLFLGGKALSVPVYLGMMILAGISVNNAILIVEAYLIPPADKHSLAPITLSSLTLSRKGPVLLTTSTTLAGLFPLACATESNPFWSVFSLTIISGLLASTVFAFFLLPLLARYSFFRDLFPGVLSIKK